jgi:hypothetical protein
VNPFATIVLEKRLPTVFSYREFFATGGLISYERAPSTCVGAFNGALTRVAFLTAPLDRKDSYQSIAPVARCAGYPWGR